MDLTETQVKHRIDIEKITVVGDAKRSDRGLVFGFLTCLASFSCAAYLGHLGATAPAITAVIAPIAAVVSSFVYGSQNRRKERENRLSAMMREEREANTPALPPPNDNRPSKIHPQPQRRRRKNKRR